MPGDLTVTDALGYLDQVKREFKHNLQVYVTFLDVMKEFKSQAIDTPGVIERVSNLFRGRPVLIEGFNTFLPQGYSIHCNDTMTLVTVTSPSGGSRTIVTDGPRIPGAPESPSRLRSPSVLPPETIPNHAHPSATQGSTAGPSHHHTPTPQEIGTTAVEYVYKIKQRCDTETYREFRTLLQQIQNNQLDPDNDMLTRKIWQLFSHDPDLRADFKVFVPENMPWPPAGVEPDDEEAIARHRRKRKEREKEQRDREREAAKVKRASRHSDAASSSHHRSHRSHRDEKHRRREDRASDTGGTPRSRRHKTQLSHLRHSATRPKGSQHPLGSTTVLAPKQQPHSNFFDRVRRSLPSRDVYNEFLKIINLFTKGFIDTKRLLEESKNFLSKELMDIFVEILGHDATRSIGVGTSISEQWIGTRPELVNIPIIHERPEDSRIRIGSYRRLPASEANVVCSGRDDMCRSVLNDQWVLSSHYISEDDHVSTATPTLTAVSASRTKKPADTQTVVPIQHTSIRHNPFLEALHRSEEERHEYGFHIDAIGRTIGMLEPLSNKILSLATQDERMAFRVKGGFGLPPSGFGGVPINGAGGALVQSNAQIINQTKPIHHRIIRKVYGLEDGNKVLQAMQDAPAMAIPVVLARLKQKEAEWKRAQSEWNKVWRLMDETNYHRSLDFMALTSSSHTFGAGNKDGTLVGGYSVSGGGVNSYGTGWKGRDRRLFQPSALVREIEMIREEQARARGSLIDATFARGKKRWQLSFSMADVGGDLDDKETQDVPSDSSENSSKIPKDTLQTIHLLMFAFLDRTPITQIPIAEKKKIEAFLKGFAALFWNIDLFAIAGRSAGMTTTPATNGGGNGRSRTPGTEDTEITDDDDSGSVSTQGGGNGGSSKKPSSSKKNKSSAGGDLRKRLLKSEQARSRRAKALPDNGARFLNDVLPSMADPESKLKGGNTIFWTNNNFYALLRMLELFYARMKLFKDLSKEIAAAKRKAADESGNSQTTTTASTGPIASDVSNEHENAMDIDPAPLQVGYTFPEDEYYAVLLDSIEKVFDNELEQTAFEDLVRKLYGVQHSYKAYTIDKLIGAIVKQVQAIFTDPKSQDLLEILKSQKLAGGTPEAFQEGRDKVEDILGSDDNLYRIDWNPDTRLMTMQLIGKGDSAVDNSDAVRERWSRYIESYTSTEHTVGVPQDRVRKPFLRRNAPVSPARPRIVTRDEFGIKICVRTYRMFYVDEGEDVLWNTRSGILPTTDKTLAMEKRRSGWLDRAKKSTAPPIDSS